MIQVLYALVALVLVGDYLMLSASRFALGTNSNWLLLVGVAQVAALGLAMALRQGRSVRMNVPMLGFLGMGLLMLVHAANRATEVGHFQDYGTVKTITFFVLSGPAFLLGCVLGSYERLPGARWFPIFAAPLLLACAAAVLTDPGAMTMRPTADLAVFFGVIVFPVHQALAFSLGKISLWLHAVSQDPERAVPQPILLGLIGFCIGMAVLSGSRGYLIAAVLALAAQWWLGRRRTGVLVLAAGIPLLVFVGLGSEVVRDGLDPTLVASSYSMRERLGLYEAALDAFLASPVLGHGPGGFALFYGFEERVYPHNVFLEVMAELGIVGLGCFLLILIPVSARAIRMCTRGTLTEVQFFAIGFFVFSLIGSLGVADLIRNHFLFLAAGMTAVSCAPIAQRAPRRTPAGNPVTAT